MKSAFLLMATALFVAGEASAFGGRSGSCCDSGCTVRCAPAPTCCDSCGRPSLLDRLRDAFHRDRCCDPCPTTCCKPVCTTTCCKPAPCCQTRHHDCCDSCRPSLFERIRSRFHRDCCNTCGDPCCGSSVAPPVKGEPVGPPTKKMPKAGEPPVKSVELINPTITTPPAAAPTIQSVPVAPILEGENRNPF